MWQIKRDNLNESLDVIAMVPEKLGLASSEYIRVRGKQDRLVMSVASYLSGEAIVEGEGDWPFKEDFYLDRRTFVPWVGAARESRDKHRFQFYRKHDQLYLTHGHRNVIFDNQKRISGYGDLSRIHSNGSDYSIPITRDLKEILRCGSNCAVADTIQPHLNCVYTIGKGDNVVSYAASDYVFYMGTGKLNEGKISTVPFPLFLINLLDVSGLRKITCIGKYVLLKFKHGVIWQPISEEASLNFPIARIKRYSKEALDIPVSFTTSRRRFSRMMVRLGYYLQSVKRRDWVLIVEGEKGDQSIRLRTEIPGVHFKEKLDVSDKLPKSFKIEWPLATLVPVFEFLSKRTHRQPLVVRINHARKTSYVKAGSYWLTIPSRKETV